MDHSFIGKMRNVEMLSDNPVNSHLNLNFQASVSASVKEGASLIQWLPCADIP